MHQGFLEGLVFTVSGPISASMYFTSLYSGFFVPVLARAGAAAWRPYQPIS